MVFACHGASWLTPCCWYASGMLPLCCKHTAGCATLCYWYSACLQKTQYVCLLAYPSQNKHIPCRSALIFFFWKHKKYHTVGTTTPGVALWFAYADGMMPVCGLMSWYAAAMVLVCCWYAAAMLLVCSWYATLCYWYVVCHPKHSRRLAFSTLHL